MRSIILLLVTLALAGCAAPTSYTIAFAGPDSDRELVVNAIAEWNACGVVTVELVDGSADATVEQIADDFSGDAFADPTVNAYTDEDHSRVRYKSRYGAEVTGRDITHELGHVMGLQHTAQGIMQAESPPDHVTPFDCSMLSAR